MFCYNCGKEIPPKAKFCPNCGVPVAIINAKEDAKVATTGIENGHEWVDLGLSVKWATCDIGADRPEEYGSRFAWGEVSPKNTRAWIGYRFLRVSRDFIDPLTIPIGDVRTRQGKRNLDLSLQMDDYIKLNLSKYNESDGITRLDLSDDAARVHWGGRWRIPTESEFGELRARCLWKWSELGGMNGYKVIGSNGNSIFLPVTGIPGNQFWLSDLGEYGCDDAICFVVQDPSKDTFAGVGYAPRCFLKAVRPVLG